MPIEALPSTHTVKRSEVKGRDLYTCQITDKNTKLTYSASKLIQDFTDSYECRISYNKPLLLNQQNTTVKLNASLWNRNTNTEIIENPDSSIPAGERALTFSWFILTQNENSEKDLATGEEITISTNNNLIPLNGGFTVICRISGSGGRVFATNLVTFQSVPDYQARVTPQNFFIQTDNNGANILKDSETVSCEITFQIVDKNGTPLEYQSTGSTKPVFKSIDDDGVDGGNFTSITAGKWDFKATLTFDKDYNWGGDKTITAKAYEFTYQIWGQTFTEEINIIKSFAGAQGTPGQAGYTVDLSNEFHAFAGGEAIAEPNQETTCLVSAFFSAEGKTIEEIRVDSTTNDSSRIYWSKGASTGSFTTSNNLIIKASKVMEGLNQITNKVLLTLTSGTNDKRVETSGEVNFYIRLEGMDSFFLKTFKYIINYNGKSFYLSPSEGSIRYIQSSMSFSPSSITVAALYRNATIVDSSLGQATSYTEGSILYSFNKTGWKKYGSSIQINSTSVGTNKNLYLRLYSSKATSLKNLSANAQVSNPDSYSSYILDEETIPILTSMEGFVVGGENLLKWSRTLPVETGKWTKSP